MKTLMRIERAGPLTTLQDDGRHGFLAHGISASGPMDRGAYRRAGLRAGTNDGSAIEFTRAGLDLTIIEGSIPIGWDGGHFAVAINGLAERWPSHAELRAGDRLSITPGPSGNYGYLRFGGALDLPQVLGSRSTNMRARIGGLEGRQLRAGDVLALAGVGSASLDPDPEEVDTGPIRMIWGIHAERFSPAVRQRFVGARFKITSMMDRMGVRLEDSASMFAGVSILSLVSEPVVAGDIQILGDGTPIVLMRDHQPTGGYPRIGTVITADLDRFSQLRSGETVAFTPVSVEHAHKVLRSRQA